jgi:hypothetical protein
MMQFVMQPGMVYQYPLWGVGILLVGLAALGAVFFELAVHQFLSVEFRRGHNDVAAAIFSVIGVTFAVLLAFVAMLAWDGFNKAKAASYAEASGVLDVYNASVGFADPDMSAMRDDIIGYLETVVRVEWPAPGGRPDRRQGCGVPREAEQDRDRCQTFRRRRWEPACAAAAIPDAASRREAAEIACRRDHNSCGRLGSDARRRRPHDCFQLFPRLSEPRHASCDVGNVGDFRGAGADPDYRPQQPLPRRL